VIILTLNLMIMSRSSVDRLYEFKVITRSFLHFASNSVYIGFEQSRSFSKVKLGLGISQTNADFNGIQFTTHFIDFFVVETKRFVGSFVNVILTRQTCGQRSSRAAESNRRALGNYFPERICYMFLISQNIDESEI